MRSLVVAVVSVLVVASSGTAQESVPLDLTVGFGLGKGVGVDCTTRQGSTTVVLDSCNPMSIGLSGEFAAHATDHVTAFARASWATASLDSTSRFDDPWLGSVSIPFESSAKAIGVSGGGRFYFQPRRARVRGFADVSAAIARQSVNVSALGFEDSSTETVFGIGVSVGADVAVSPRVLIRFSGGPGFAFPDEGTSTGVGGGVGVVFRLRD